MEFQFILKSPSLAAIKNLSRGMREYFVFHNVGFSPSTSTPYYLMTVKGVETEDEKVAVRAYVETHIRQDVTGLEVDWFSTEKE